MNRCLSKTTRFTPAFRFFRLGAPAALLAALALSHLGLSAQVISRAFPPTALRGAMQITQPPELVMNGKADRLSPGARIHGTNNMLLLSGTLVGQNLLVNFVREPQGQIHEVWILNAAEAQLPRPNAH